MNLDELTPEQQEKARGCKTLEDVLVLAKEEGYELTSEELSAIDGAGDFWHPDPSDGPRCQLRCPTV
ncbi:MAG: Nif11-like leader peptide family natural product precursor [Atopobiaceae bacterium]|nr:Nif11-like leader peptide family natural product precursor [Atopobiaceae bacterium]MBR3314579.1 Nif11-like leader peptide family natural product precursor [Atopobiaceae bacterium]